MALLDWLLRLADAIAGTASVTGGWLDMRKGTTEQQYNTSSVQPALISPFQLFAQIVVTGSSGGPSTTFTLRQADDTGGTNLEVLATVVVTADGVYKIPFAPTRRFVRLDSAWTAGTLPYSAAVSL